MKIGKSQFLNSLTRSRLLNTDALNLSVGLASTSPNWQALAIGLIHRGLLTKWQAEQLANGRTRFQLGDYLLQNRIGGGATGTVYEAKHSKTQERFAIKVLAPHLAVDPIYLERFRREFDILRTLSHPNIVRCYESQRVHDTEFLVMDLLPGSDLAKWIAENGRMPPASACRLAEQAATGLAHLAAHGLVHRDIKPSNLIAWNAPDKSSLRLNIVDFGLARHSTHDGRKLTTNLAVLGSIDYMAPEQFENASAVNEHADIFSLGATLYNMLTGRGITTGSTLAEKISERVAKPLPSIRQALPSCDPGVAAVVDRCLEKDPARRFSSAESLATALSNLYTKPTRIDTRNDETRLVTDVRSPVLASELSADESAHDLKEILGILKVKDSQQPESSEQSSNESAPKQSLPILTGLLCALLSCSIGIALGYFQQGRLSVRWPQDQRTIGSQMVIGEEQFDLSKGDVTEFALPSGTHKISLVRPSFEPNSSNMRLAFGAHRELQPDWRPTPSLVERRTLDNYLWGWKHCVNCPANETKMRQLRGNLNRFLTKPLSAPNRSMAMRVLDSLPSEFQSRVGDWNKNAKVLWTMGPSSEGHSKWQSLAISADGSRLAIGAKNGRVVIRDVFSRAHTHDFKPHASPVRFLCFTNRDRQLVSHSKSMLTLTNVEDVAAARSMTAKSPVDCASLGEVVAFHHQGAVVIRSSHKERRDQISVQSQRPLVSLTRDGAKVAVLDGKKLIVKQTFIDPPTTLSLPSNLGDPKRLFWFPNGQLAVQSERLLMLAPESLRQTFSTKPSQGQAIAASHSDVLQVVDGRVQSMLANGTFRPQTEELFPRQADIIDIAVSPKGNVAAVLEANGRVKVVRLKLGAPKRNASLETFTAKFD